MRMFWKHKTTTTVVSEADIERVKSPAHEAADLVNKSAKRVNRSLIANGITLNIYRASHGEKHV